MAPVRLSVPGPTASIPPVSAVPGERMPERVRLASDETAITRASSFRAMSAEISGEPEVTANVPPRVSLPPLEVIWLLEPSIVVVRTLIPEVELTLRSETVPSLIDRSPRDSLRDEWKLSKPSEFTVMAERVANWATVADGPTSTPADPASPSPSPTVRSPGIDPPAIIRFRSRPPSWT